MKRRNLLLGALALGTVPFISSRTMSKEMTQGMWQKTEDEWRRVLTREQYYILREEGTERPFTSPLNDEKRKGTFVCAACELPLFSSDMKYDSGTGWPSFFTTLPNAIETKLDFKLLYPRTEYHCSRCGGHQGHVFKDGPEPTGQRWCNNGVALKFIPV
ncbi:MAG: peptide-methionine (R)-S-oxide reductase MsrB [Gammaproteobacteria bacterium]|nr:peptide-methionine (R)-S-oxide reductase MsrB [Gammaproteobacteria bacterium]